MATSGSHPTDTSHHPNPTSVSKQKNNASLQQPQTRVANSCRYRLEFPIRDNTSTFAVVPAVHQFLELVYHVNPSFQLHSMDGQGVLSSFNDLPTTENQFRQFFEIHSNSRRIMVGFTATSTMPIGTLKKGRIFDYLQQNKIWFGEHKFQTLKLRECGSLYGKHHQWTHRGHLTAMIQKHLAAVYSEVTETTIGSGAIPYFEIRQQDLVHRNRDHGKPPQTYRTTALTIWCDAIHIDQLQQILMDHLDEHQHGKFIPTGSTSGVNDNHRAEIIVEHNQWLETTMCIKVRNCCPAVMNVLDTHHQSLIRHLTSITINSPSAEGPTPLFRSVEPTRDVHTTGRYFFLVDKQLYHDAVKYIDQGLQSDYNTALQCMQSTDRKVMGNPTREGPRNIPEGRPITISENLSQTHISYRSGPRRRPPTVVFTKSPPPSNHRTTDTGPTRVTPNAWRQGPPQDTESAGSSITPRRDNGSQVSRETISEISTIFTQFSAQLQESERRHKQQQEAQQQFTRDMIAAQQQFQTQQMTQLREITGQFTSILSTLQPVLIAAATKLTATTMTTPPARPHETQKRTGSPQPSSPASAIIGKFSPIREAMETSNHTHDTNQSTANPSGGRPSAPTPTSPPLKSSLQVAANHQSHTPKRAIPSQIGTTQSKTLSPITPGRSWADMDEEEDEEDKARAINSTADPLSIQDSLDISHDDELMSTDSNPRRHTATDSSFDTQQVDNRDATWRQVEGKPRRRHRSSISPGYGNPRSPPSMRTSGRGYGGRGG